MIRKCGDCGYEGQDTGDSVCDNCGSENTYVIVGAIHMADFYCSEQEIESPSLDNEPTP